MFLNHLLPRLKAVGLIPPTVVKIAESGIEDANAAKVAFNLGFNAVLVGTTLSKLDNINDFFNELRQ